MLLSQWRKFWVNKNTLNCLGEPLADIKSHIDFVAGTPHPIGRVALCGEALGCSYIRLIHPVDSLIFRYEQAGFKVATNKIHRICCGKPLKRS